MEFVANYILVMNAHTVIINTQMKKIIFIPIIVLCLVSFVSATSTLLDEYQGANTIEQMVIPPVGSGVPAMAINITQDISTTDILRIQLNFTKNNNPSAHIINFTIWNDSSGAPTGKGILTNGVLCTNLSLGADLPTSGLPKNISFTGCNLPIGRYHIVMVNPYDDGSNRVRTARDNAGTYGGTAYGYTYTVNWNTWDTSNRGRDVLFRAFKITTGTTPPTITSILLTSQHITGTNTTSDSTPTFNYTLNENGYVRLQNATNSYDGMTSARDCVQSTGTTGICTIIASDELAPDGLHYVYFTALDYDGNNHTTPNATVLVNVTQQNCGFANLSKYEYETNLTFNCIYDSDVTIDSIVDSFSVTGGTPYDYTINTLREYHYNTTFQKLNYSVNGNATVSLDNRTDIVQFLFGVYGFSSGGNYPLNLLINVAGQVFNLKGTLYGYDLYSNKFEKSGTEYTAYNLSYSSAGTQTINMNVSAASVSDSTNHFKNVTFQYSGFGIDNQNAFSFTEYFNDTTHLSSSKTTVTSLGTFDNFENNVTSLATWDTGGTCVSCTYSVSTGNYDDYYRMYLDSENGKTQFIDSDGNLDLRNRAKVDINFSIDAYAYGFGGYCPYSPGAWIYFYVYITDGTTNVPTYSYSVTAENGGLIDVAFTKQVILLNHPGTNNWDVYDPTYSKTISTSTLDNTKNWDLKFYQTVGAQCSFNPIQIDSYVRYVKLGGLKLNKGTNDTAYNATNGIFYSTSLFSAPTNITAATLTYDSIVPTNTSISPLISNNNCTNFTSTLSGIRTVFTDIGNQLCVAFNMTTGNTSFSPEVLSYNVQISPGSASGINIDFGQDGTNDCSFAGILNESTSPQNCTVTGNLMYSYLSTYYPYSEYATVPMSVSINSSGGVVQLSSLNVTQNLTSLKVNNSLIEALQSVPITVQTSQGIAELRDLKADYAGSHNLSIDISGINYVIRVLYSKFNLSLPYNIDYWEVFPKSRNESNVQPYGQSDTTPIFNLTSYAYDNPINIYIKYNESINSCVTNAFRGFNFSSVKNMTKTVSTSPQIINYAIPVQNNSYIWTYTNVSCVNNKLPFVIPYYCFFSMCDGCVITDDYNDNCEVYQ